MKKAATLFLILLSARLSAGSPLIDKLLSRNETDRAEALNELRGLGQYSRQELIPGLVSAMGSGDAVVASWSTNALIVIGPEAAPALLQFIRDKKDGANYGTVALSRLGSSAIPTLKTALADADPNIRYQALLALKLMGGSNAGACAVEVGQMLTRESDPQMRQAAATSLGAMWSSASPALPQVIQSLQDNSEAVRNESVATLGKMGKSAEPAIPHLINGLDDSSHPLSEEFVRGTLQQMRTESALQALEKLGVHQTAEQKYETRQPNATEETRRSSQNRFESRQSHRLRREIP